MKLPLTDTAQRLAAGPAAQGLWENRRVIGGVLTGVIGGLWLVCGVLFEEADAFLVGAAFLTPLVAYGALLATTAAFQLRPAPAPVLTPVADAERERDERREERRQTRVQKKS